MKKLAISLALSGLLGASATSYAALEDLGNGMIYDTDLNLTWLADANYSKTSAYSTTGVMSWYGATTWAENLTFQGNSNWRLPTVSEMSHLFYQEIGGSHPNSIFTSHNANYNLFNNFQSGYYWSSTETPNNPNYEQAFKFDGGWENSSAKTAGLYAMAVTAVPEPETYAMFLAGLGLLGWRMRRARS